MTSRFENVELLRFVGDLAMLQRFDRDVSEIKIDIGIGVNYYGLQLKFPVVREAERNINKDGTLFANFLPLLGLEPFIESAIRLLLGKDSSALEEDRAFGVQVVGGTAGLRLASEYLVKTRSSKYIYLSEPSIKSHLEIFTRAGLECREYRYWSAAKKCLNIDGMIADLRLAPEGSAVLLHGCSHYPTGCDLSHEEWILVIKIIESGGLFPIIHMPFFGMASGSFDDDAWIVRYLVERRITMICIQSFSKIMGLCSERVANLLFVSTDIYACEFAKSIMKFFIRVMYSEPPSYGARIATCVMNVPSLFEEWKQNIEEIYHHCTNIRFHLRDQLEQLDTPGDWAHTTAQKGMFWFSGLNERQVLYMLQNYHIYMRSSGRIYLCAIIPEKVKYIAEAIDNTVRNVR